ncbi:MAG: Rrf2 family transcriptional regulator [bacterium]|nr:Rrf2 family transcriptional regulator [bacterium]
MKLSTKGRYGLRAMLDLAVYGEEQPVSIRSISERQNISESYLEQLIAKLKKAGLVESVRGAGGGYHIARDASKISVGEVLYALEGDLNPVDCGAILAEGGCRNEKECLSRYAWQKIHQSIQNTVDHMYLSELIEQGRAHAGKEHTEREDT